MRVLAEGAEAVSGQASFRSRISLTDTPFLPNLGA